MTIIMTSSNYYEEEDVQVGHFCCVPKTPETGKLNEIMTPSDIRPPLFRPRHIEHRHTQEEINKEGLKNEAFVNSKTILLLNIEDSDEAGICTPNGRHTGRGKSSLLARVAPRKATLSPKCFLEHSATEDHCHYSPSVTLKPRLESRLSYDDPQEDSKQEENISLFQDKQEDCIPLPNRLALSGKEEEEDEGEQLNNDRKKSVQSKLPDCVLLTIVDDDDDTIDSWSKNKNKSTNIDSIRHSFPSSNFSLKRRFESKRK